MVPALIDAIAAQTWSGAWTASVVGLTSPPRRWVSTSRPGSARGTGSSSR
ncbi:hypothetical protein NKG05_16695 [Oerskovia sp. M15]